MRKVTKKKNIDTSKYVNVETGETLRSENENIVSINEDTKYVVLDYHKYTVIDQRVMAFLKEILPPQEIGRIYMMSVELEQRSNVIMNGEEPHTDTTLAESVNYTRSKYSDFMKKMYKASIVYKLQGYWEGRERTLFILNPHLARVSKTIKKDILALFQNISTKKGQAIVRKALEIS